MNLTVAFVGLHLAVELAIIVRVILRPHRNPASRIAWVTVIAALPVLGMLWYLLLGETSIGRKRIARMRRVIEEMPGPPPVVPGAEDNVKPGIPQRYEHLFRLGTSISGFEPVGGNSGRLLPDSNATIDAMVADIEAATESVHLLFYIWLADNNGKKVMAAMERAARRGITCRVMVDGLGSRSLVRSRYWRAMQDAGVRLAVALPITSILQPLLGGRVDLRNHRKIVVIDDRVSYCGSQNCADPEFLVKARFAPWVDAVIRFEGPIVRQNQYLFASDWMTYANENIDELLKRPVSATNLGFTAQVIGTGPTSRHSALPDLFADLCFTARQELVISTPYYVPDEAMQNALCASGFRGIRTSIIFPAVNDSWVVGGASRSYYRELLDAGVNIYEYVGGLLHTKSVTLDGEVTLIGSANMDRRSFDLNYENNILFCDAELTSQVRQRQQEYMDRARAVTLKGVSSWSVSRRLWNNSLAMLGPIL